MTSDLKKVLWEGLREHPRVIMIADIGITPGEFMVFEEEWQKKKPELAKKIFEQAQKTIPIILKNWKDVILRHGENLHKKNDAMRREGKSYQVRSEALSAEKQTIEYNAKMLPLVKGIYLKKILDTIEPDDERKFNENPERFVRMYFEYFI